MSDDDKREVDKDVTSAEPDGPEQTPGQPAVEQSPENLPAAPGQVHQVGTRHGMFGVRGSGDTSGYGGLVSAVTYPAPSQRPYGGWFDEVADALEAATRAAGVEQAVGSVVVHRGEITFHVRREDLLTVARVLRDDEALRFELCSSVSGVHYPDDTASRPRPPTPTRTRPRSCRSTRPPTGTSARPTTCSASSSTATPRSRAS